MEKISIELFRNTFQGRVDIVPEYYSSGKSGYTPICANKFKQDICRIKKGAKKPCSGCSGKVHQSLTDELIKEHLNGKRILGVYPLLPDNTCHWCAADLDNHGGNKDPKADVIAYNNECQKNGIPLYVVRSKSGEGYHAYVFFTAPIAAWKARAVCFEMLRQAKVIGANAQLSSFDRLFPNQDCLSGKGLGNLIGLPFQGEAMKKGHTLFLDPKTDFIKPFEDQTLVIENATNEEQLDHVIAIHSLEQNDQQTGSGVHSPKKGPDPWNGFTNVQYESLFNKCGFLRHCRDNASTLDEPSWYSMTSNVARLKGGVDLVHKLSSPYTSYSKEETDQKILHAMNDAGPHTCRYIEEVTSGEFCIACPSKNKVRSPVALVNKYLDNQGEQAYDHTATMYDLPPENGEHLGLKMPKKRDFIYDGPGGLPRGVVAVRSGQGGCAKTTLEIQIICSITSGVDCSFGALNFNVRGPVIAVLAEDSKDDVERTISHIREEIEQKFDLMNLHLIPRRAGDPRFFTKDNYGHIQMTEGYKKFKTSVKAIKPVYIMIDSYSITCGEGEMNNADAAFIMATISELCDTGDNATVMIIAHSNKASLSGKGNGGKNATPEDILNQALDPNSVRGASAIVNNARWCGTMTLVPPKVRGTLNCPTGTMLSAYAVRKTNYTKPFEIGYLKHDVRNWDSGASSMILKPFDKLGAFLINDNDLKSQIIKIISNSNSVTKRDFNDDLRVRTELGISRGKLRTLVEELLNDETLYILPKGNSKILKLTNEPDKVDILS